MQAELSLLQVGDTHSAFGWPSLLRIHQLSGAPWHRNWHGEINASWSRLKLWYANANTMYHLFVLWSQWEAPTAPPPLPFPLFHFSLSPLRRFHLPNVSSPTVARGSSDGAIIPPSALLVSSPPFFALRLLSSQTVRSPRGEFLPSIFSFLAFFFPFPVSWPCI